LAVVAGVAEWAAADVRVDRVGAGGAVLTRVALTTVHTCVPSHHITSVVSVVLAENNGLVLKCSNRIDLVRLASSELIESDARNN